MVAPARRQDPPPPPQTLARARAGQPPRLSRRPDRPRPIPAVAPTRRIARPSATFRVPHVNRRAKGTPDRRVKRTPAATDRGCPGSEQEGPARVAKCPHERRSGARGRCPVCPPGQPRGGGPGAGWLIPAEALGRFDRLEFVEVEVVDGLQRLGGGAFVKAFGQDLEPRPILGLRARRTATASCQRWARLRRSAARR